MTNRKNILILMHNDATQFIDIANQYAALFDKNLYHVTVAYLSGEQDENTKKRTISETVLFFSFSKKAIRGLKIKAIQKLIALCREKNFSLVVSHRYKPAWIMLWVSRFVKIPTLIFVMHAMETLHGFFRKWFITAFIRKNMYFAGVSDAVRHDLSKSLRQVPDNNLITLYNCIDMQDTESRLFERSLAREKLQLPNDALVFGTVGRLVPDKDQTTLLQAFAKIKSELPHAKLLIAGEGVLKEELKALARSLQIDQDVMFTGFLPEACRYLTALDVFVLSSVEEAFGRVLLEAMVARVPVIGTNINGIPEVIGDAGRIVPARDAEALSLAMLDFASRPRDALQAIGKQGYDRVRACFSMEKFRADFWGWGFSE